jgi:beta-glucosidase-like glycosyl hydrolase
MPTDPDACIDAIEAAVNSGRIAREHIDASVERILAAKKRAGVWKDRYVKLDGITLRLDVEKFESVAGRAITLMRHRHLVAGKLMWRLL